MAVMGSSMVLDNCKESLDENLFLVQNIVLMIAKNCFKSGKILLKDNC